eukprot:105411-Chlamydomonas_euryale.AAC.1
MGRIIAWQDCRHRTDMPGLKDADVGSVARSVLANRVLQGVSNGTYRFPVVDFQTGAVQVILPSRFPLHTEDGTCLG